MNWEDVSEPGYTIHKTQAGNREFRIQSKQGLGIWRLFIKENAETPLKTIYVGDGLEACKNYAEAYNQLNGGT